MLGNYLNLHRDSRRMPGMLGDRVSSVCLLSLRKRRRLIGSAWCPTDMAPFHPADVCGNLVGKPRPKPIIAYTNGTVPFLCWCFRDASANADCIAAAGFVFGLRDGPGNPGWQRMAALGKDRLSTPIRRKVHWLKLLGVQ